MNASPRLRDTRGMTLPELMVAMVISLLVLGTGLAFFNAQARALRAGTGQFVLTQNYRVALSTLASQVRTAGTNLAPGQPYLVYAGSDAIAINADYVSRDPHDLFAASADTSAPVGESEALVAGERISIPGSSFSYPDTTYRVGDANSGAETMVFWFESDTSTARGDDFVLYRKVNTGPPAVVARNLLRTPGKAFFEYLYLADHDDQPQTVEVFPAREMAHSAPVHGRTQGARPDSGAVADIDRIRAVRVNLTATDGQTGTAERRRQVSRLILLPNAGVTRLESCGETPQLGSTFTATSTPPGAPSPAVTLHWGPAADESGGEKDVLRYIVWKRAAGAPDWGPPFVSVSAGLTDYVYVDDQVDRGSTYEYAVAAQDCTPSQSPRILSSVRVQ
jgi:prepilin-type N-terminal cleavage/methylation domain-containing protein